MGIILDVIVIAIFALNIFICYKKGLVRLAVGLIAVLTAIVLSIILYKPISNLVIKNTELFFDNDYELVAAQMDSELAALYQNSTQ